MSKHHKHGKPGKHANQLREVERYNRQTMQDYCLAWSIYLTEQGNTSESEIALLWGNWVMKASARDFNTACDSWYTWDKSQPQQLDLFAA